ncbi:hypothetical protein Rhow_002501 [Rhodococcus wratislaviensis]|uniref:Uncharacterized protein n=1 Tax=Rhodococcus wratislaviensis TaxID=44752 RepID=A0A402C613_RHOWR|nr:hypothetical protein Rhow_002501 [Rhodococcus wratislaviensis]
MTGRRTCGNRPHRIFEVSCADLSQQSNIGTHFEQYRWTNSSILRIHRADAAVDGWQNAQHDRRRYRPALP